MRYWPILVALLFSSCANLSLTDVYRTPDFQYQSTRLTAVSLDALTGQSSIQIRNRNPYQIPVSELETELWLEGQPWLTLSNRSIGGLPANGTIETELDWALVYDELARRAGDVYRAGEATLTLRMRPTLDVPVLGPQTLDWSAQFTVPIPKLPKLRLTDWSVRSLTLTEVTLALGVEVENPNVFSIATRGVALDLDRNGRSLASLGLADQTLDSKTTRTQQVMVSLSILDVGLSLANALNSGEWPQNLNLDWQGNWSSSDLAVPLPSLPGGQVR
ncbi:LEA type 2 family protein [Reinekea blandensis]|uniref:Late embryogenesis abundant protein LEA-2 subgroup domain-containing protein n=1 Tax=Reinekea blandensis MED297 TaxID=314283 RepID=A4BAE2_9GAMM|nr:LEA type 2 family protein [Reinekea blandensis]EAR10898.1 hypothetical protein MED297_10321 [Reinekea sp. MED297] [Reinekea blandensis MED297]